MDPFQLAMTYRTSNQSPGPVSGKSVVIHSTRSGKMNNPNELSGTIDWFLKPDNVSAHLIIGRDGTIVRMVNDSELAWHAREWNALSWGIELCQGTVEEPFTEAQYLSLVVAMRHYHDTFGVPLIHASRDFIDGFIGHDEIPPGLRDGKTDPGKLFDWKKVIGMANGELQPNREELRGKQRIFYNNGVPVLKLGDEAGDFPGRLAKLFGEDYYWLRKSLDGSAIWTLDEGD